MLQDWLTMLVVHYNELLLGSKEVIKEEDIDVTFEKHPKILVLDLSFFRPLFAI